MAFSPDKSQLKLELQTKTMHELGITRSVIAICVENSGGAVVKRVTLEIGKLSAILPDAVRFCFDICAKGTVVEGAALEILEIQGLQVH